jgi:hypothetical protein
MAKRIIARMRTKGSAIEKFCRELDVYMLSWYNGVWVV